MRTNRRWTLAARPQGAVQPSDFALVELPVDDAPLAPGEIMVRNVAFSVAPTIRNRLKPPHGNHRGAIAIGGAIGGMAVSEVIASANPNHPIGQRLVAMAQWEDVSRLAPDRSPVPPFPLPADASVDDALGILSPNSLTAYFGMAAIGRPAAGETVLVSGAAGAVGTMACQIARILGARVIAIAGTAEKCRWLREVCRVDATIDYRADDVSARLSELAPTGVDVFFDNVGGTLLQNGVDRMARHGRIVVCGQISAYDGDGAAPGPSDMMKVVYGALTIRGFVVGDFVDQTIEAQEQLRRWAQAGELVVRLDKRQGLAALPAAFVDLFRGGNDGALIVVNDDRDRQP
jgi:NADPH-dependent curcumin reductase CurA